MLTRRMQIQAIADMMAGMGNGHMRLQDFEEPWRSISRAIAAASAEKRQQALIEALNGRSDRDSIIGAIMAAVPGEQAARFPSLAEIADGLPPVEWLWEDWVPRGMITMLGAVPGAGKSYVALDLARRIIAGDQFPDGTPVSQSAANVIYVDAEVVPQLINERALAWQMDCHRLYLMLPQPNGLIDFGESVYRDQLVEMAYQLQPELVVIDSLSSISSRGENSIEDVRTILAFLNGVAASYRCGLVLIHHLRKRGPMPLLDVLTIDDFRGSSHIIAMARSVLGLSVIQTGPGQDRNGPRRLEVVKTNLARYPEPIGVEFLSLHPKGVLLHYGDPPAAYQKPTKTDECTEWLLQTLKDAGQPMKPRDVTELAKEAGFSRSTVYNARSLLGEAIQDTEVHSNHPDNLWVLAEESV